MKKIFSVLFLLTITLTFQAQVSFGDPLNFNDGWKFQRGDFENAEQPEFNDSRWRQLDLPHDWTVEGPYSPSLASATGYLPGGIAWYRKVFTVPPEKENKRVYIYFEGIYRDGEVFINGHSLGMRPNGYISYMYDLTPHIRLGEENTISVRVDHSKYADSRWYTGSGIYRDVYLVYANPVHIDQWGVFYTTPVITDRQAKVQVETSVKNTSGKSETLTINHEIKDRNGNRVARTSGKVTVGAATVNKLTADLSIGNPRRWSLDDPYMYELHTSVYRGRSLLDKTVTNLGVRTFDFDPKKGFSLNGVNMKVKGVCLHHDAGALGAAVPEEVWRRRLLELKALGTNAIRTSHNPQAPALYKLCDELGLLVINEAFDEWEFPKKKWIEGWNQGTPGFQGHAEFFEEWGEQDLRDMILRDRNHPSVFMWSIGNEVDYPNDPYSHPILNEQGIQQQHTSGYQPNQPHADRLGAIAIRLADIVRELDPSRPVTAGLAGPIMSNETDYPGALDVVGYNYTERRYAEDHAKYPDRVFYGSENGHSLDAWKAVRDNDYVFGQFLWTGIDYLGESHRWPSRGFTSGLLDLTGFKKPRAWFRQSLWSDAPMVYLGTYQPRRNERSPSIDAPAMWNYNDGETIRVVSYTNCEMVQLMLNGKNIEEPKSHDDETGVIVWDIPFEPGKIEVIGLNQGTEVARYTVETSKRPQAINAVLLDNAIDINKGVVHIEIQIVDEDGKPVFLSDDEVTCTIEGPAKLLALEASNPRDMGDYTNNSLRVYQGRLVAYVQATGEKGIAIVKFSSPWLEGAEVELTIR